jgi:streptogramin lyase
VFTAYEAVPTEVKRGPDGALWVSTLSGAPFIPGAAAIWRVVPGSVPVKIISGLTLVADFDIAADGTVWVSRYASAPFFGGPSAIDRIAPDGTRTSYLVGEVSQPTGIAVGPDGAIYVSNRGSQANVGEVLRFVP